MLPVILIVIFLAVVYIFTFIKMKRRRRNYENAVDHFNKVYRSEDEDEIDNIDSSSLIVDFIDKDKLYEEVQNEIKESNKEKSERKIGTFKF